MRAFRQHERERAPLPWVAVGPDLSPVELHQFTAERYGEADCGFGGSIASFDLVKPIEYAALFRNRDAAAGIGDRNLHQFGPLRRVSYVDPDLASGWRKLDCVVEQVGNDLGHAMFVQWNFRQIRLHFGR